MTVSGNFLVIDEKRNRKIKISEIIYCEADINYTVIHLGYRKLVCSFTLKLVETLLVDFTFVRTHRKYLINQAFIQNIDSLESTVKLSSGLTLPISRRNFNVFTR
ncbi:MAG: LytTR family DNA-binding domain-containing protein [Bacteroidota bacterium]